MSGIRENFNKIMIVDDEKLILLAMSAKLKREGYVPVPVGDVDSAVGILKENPKAFGAIITDIMMGDMDGFVFRDIVRGIDRHMPMFFLTALDPEEGSGFLKKILDDPQSYYLPKSVKTDVLLKRVRQIVASRRVERFIEEKIESDKKSLELAAHIQRSMLPFRAVMTPRGQYSALWRPLDIVSGDLYEAVPFGFGSYLYLLGDIQGHGTSAALAMTAVQSFLKHLSHRSGAPSMSPSDIANLLHKFFRSSLPDVTYMTALICIHSPLVKEVRWISCGAPDLVVVDNGAELAVNPERKGGLPIGLMPQTTYSREDEITTELSPTALCIAFTDGLLDLSRDRDGSEKLPDDLRKKLCCEVIGSSRGEASVMASLHKFMTACDAFGYDRPQDDLSILVFGARCEKHGVFEASIPLAPSEIDGIAQDMGQWCRDRNWDEESIGRLQLVLEEKLMNVYDHGFDDRDRLHEVASVRLLKNASGIQLTVWDCGTPEPSIQVATGDASVAFDLANQAMSGHGRGRLMVRELCSGVERNRYGEMNETVYHLKPVDAPQGEANGGSK